MQISEVNIYPIKSLRGIGLQESIVEKRGLRFDRRWMITDPDGMFITQREVPKMAIVSVAVSDGGLIVRANGFGSLEVPSEPDRGRRQNVKIWQSVVEGLIYDGAVSEWFSDVLSKKCQLVLMPEATERHVSERFDTGGDIVSFADGYPLLLIGEGSLEALNERIRRRYEAENADEGSRASARLEMRRFRPSVVVKDADPFQEDDWAKIRIGETIFRVAKPCARCVITTIDPDMGEFDGKEPLKTLAGFRKAKDVFPSTYESFGHGPNDVEFGQNLIPESGGGMLSVGDPVEILETKKVR